MASSVTPIISVRRRNWKRDFMAVFYHGQATGYDGGMDFSHALQAARSMASRTGDCLGNCLFADGGCDRIVWLMGFEVAGGPADWYWHVIVTEPGPASMIAIHHRPPQEAIPSA